MKKWFRFSIYFFILIAIFGYIASFYLSQAQKKPPVQEISTNPLPSPSVKLSTVQYGDITYVFDYFEVPNVRTLSLIYNYADNQASKTLIDTHRCIAAANGGFYDTSYRPLGLFVNRSVQTPSVSSALMNGYVSITGTIPSITRNEVNRASLALQSGPILFMNSQKQLLAIKNDEYARRVGVGITSEGVLIFFTIYARDSVYEGPYLQDLPEILAKINLQLPHTIVSAMNLDGGNASIFKHDSLYLQELTPVGSIFCVSE